MREEIRFDSIRQFEVFAFVVKQTKKNNHIDCKSYLNHCCFLLRSERNEKYEAISKDETDEW